MQPVAQKARRVPFHLEQPLKKWLEQEVKEDIFQPVPENAPIKWCLPLVVQPKPRFENTLKSKLAPHMIRASIDLRVPNKYISQAAVVEDFMYKFRDCNVFSKMDPIGHYNLVVIDKRTRYPEVEQVTSTSFEQTRVKLKRIFAIHGILRRLETDNGPPFNSSDYTTTCTSKQCS